MASLKAPTNPPASAPAAAPASTTTACAGCDDGDKGAGELGSELASVELSPRQRRCFHRTEAVAELAEFATPAEPDDQVSLYLLIVLVVVVSFPLCWVEAVRNEK